MLVVDDGPENRELVKLVLEQHGLTVDEAENGLAGVEMARSVSYDVILMDVNMPGTNGIDAIKMLRFMADLEELPPICAAFDSTRCGAVSS